MRAYEVDWDAGTENAYEAWRDRVMAEDEDFQDPGASLPSQTTTVVDSTAASQETSERDEVAA
ncbi:MAG: hypothetical protein H0W31_00070 [Actinobacteria bacterium]|nr:hypothetical protein [Actinomycetota bacterium]